MATEPSTAVLDRPRRISLAPTLPREHGAWFVLTGSALIGPAATGALGPMHGIMLGAGWLALVGQAALQTQRVADRFWSVVLLGLALAAAAFVVSHASSPLLLGAAAATALLGGAHLVVARRDNRRSLGVEALGVALLTSAAPASLALSGARADTSTLGLVAATSLYFVATVPGVRARVFGVRDRAVWRRLRFDPLVFAALGALVLGATVRPAAAAAFAIPVARGLWLAARPPRALGSVSRLGWLEVIATGALVAVVALAV